MKNKVCPTCEGEGKVPHEALSVWTQDDIEADPESFEHYLAGRYDVTCPRCHGNRVVPNTRAEAEAYEERRQEAAVYRLESGLFDGGVY